MSEHSPEFEPSADQTAANDQEFGAANDAVYDLPSAEVIDITSGDAYVPGESIIEELTPTTPPVAQEPDKLIPSSYEVAMKRFGLDPNVAPIDPAPETVSADAIELDAQGEAMQALIEGIPSVSPTSQAEVAPLTSVDFDPTIPETPVAAVSPEVTPVKSAELAPTSKEVPEDILNSYKERFGINKEDLEKVEGFADLSRGQQRQVLENLAQITVGKIHTEAIDGQAEEFNAKQKDAKFLGKVWNGMKNSFTKKFDVVNREKKLAAEIQNGGIDEHKDALEQMTKGMKELGPAVNENKETGELEVQFIETNGMSPEVAKVAEVFNEQGTKLSKIPYEWSLDSASKEQRKSYDEAKETYELQRSVLMEQMKKEGGDEKAIKAMAQTESVIEMQRFIQTCPDAAEGLKNIENQSALTAALKSVGTERGLYMAGGALARTALGLVAGFAAAPAAAALMGGIRGWKRTGDELVAQDAAQRRGETPKEPENVQATRARINEINGVLLANVGDEGIRKDLEAELKTLNRSVRGTAKNMVAAFNEADIAGDKEAESGDRRRGATAKLEYLKAQIASIDEQLMSGPAADEAGNLAEKKAKLAAQLDRRVNYTKMKVSEGKMVFGAEGERLGNQYALMRSMAEAEAVLGGTEATDKNGDKAEQRLAKMLNATNEEIKDARFKKKLGQAVKAGVIGGALAGVGAAAADTVKWMNGATGTLAEKAFGDAAHVKAEIAGAVSVVKQEAAAVASSVGSGVKEFARQVQNGIEQDLSAGGATVQAATTESGMINGLDLPPDYVFPAQQPPINGLDLPPDYVFPTQETPINGLDLPPDYVFPGQEPVNGLDLPPDYVFPTQETPINGLDLPPDYKFPTPPNEEWVETPGGLNVLREDLIAAEGVPSHIVTQGENLSRIFAREIPGSSNAEVIRLLKSMSPAQLKEIGVTSGNPDLIYPGDNINVGRVREMLAESPSGVSPHAAISSPSRIYYENNGTPSSAIVEPVLPESEGDILGTPAEINNMLQRQSINGGSGTSPTGTAGIAAAAGTPGGALAPGAPRIEPHVETVAAVPPPPRTQVVFEQTNPEEGGRYVIRPVTGKGLEQGDVSGREGDLTEKGRLADLQERVRDRIAGAPAKPPEAAPQTLFEVGAGKPPKPFLEISNQEMSNWPADKPRPWPTSVVEANKVYGANPAVREMAGEIQARIGRYPNAVELDRVMELKKVDPEAADRLLGVMKESPLSDRQLSAELGKSSKYLEYTKTQQLMERVAADRRAQMGVSLGESPVKLEDMNARQLALFRRAIEDLTDGGKKPLPPGVTLQQLMSRQIQLEPRVPVPPSDAEQRIQDALRRQQNGANIPSSIPKGGVAVPEAADAIRTERLAAIDLQEQQRIAELTAAHQRNLANLAASEAAATRAQSVNSANQGVAQIANVLRGNRRLGDVLSQEVSGRMQASASDAATHRAAVASLEASHRAALASTHASYDQMRRTAG